MNNKIINIAVLSEVAKALKSLKEQMVFTGGSIIAFYSDNPESKIVRATYDVDLTINIGNYANWVALEEHLGELGIYPDPDGLAMCNYKYKNISVDIMPAEDTSIGISNRWYKIGFEYLLSVKVEKEEIQIFSAACFLATKFEAFNDRGGGDYRTSHDFEDIIYVLDNRSTIVTEIEQSDKRIRQFLQEEFTKISANRFREEILSAHLERQTMKERYSILSEKVRHISEL